MDQAHPLAGQTALLFGGGGALGGAIAEALARDGATVVLANRTRARAEAVAARIRAAGGRVEVAEADALDEASVAAVTERVAARHRRLDIAVNAIGVDHLQGVSLAATSLAAFALPITTQLHSTFLIARAAAAPMMRQRSGVLLALSVPAARLVGPGWLGHGVAFTGLEQMLRLLAAELGGHGIRVVGLRSDANREAFLSGSHTHAMFTRMAASAGLSVDEIFAGRAATASQLGRLPTLADVAEAAAFYVSPRAKAFTGTVANVTCGSVPD
jgi:NAD(P)-dependent dehydrogenase (short-subunit alcohol dehydrogenase family)